MQDSKKKIRLVAADHEFAFRQGLARLLADCDDMVVIAEASDGLEAVEAVSREQPDVAIVAISLPDVNGFEVTRLIRSASQKGSCISVNAGVTYRT